MLRRVFADASAVARGELQAIRGRVRGSVRRVVTAAALFVVAGTLALVFLGAATAALVLVLGLWVPAWLAAIIVALAAAAAGATAAAVGLKLLRRALVQEPRETAESVRRAATWVRSEVDAAAASGRTSAGAPAP